MPQETWSPTRQLKLSSTVSASEATANLKQMVIYLGDTQRIKLMYINGKSYTTVLLDLAFTQDPSEAMPMRLHHDVGWTAEKQYPEGLEISVRDFYFFIRGHLVANHTCYFMVGFKVLE